MSGPNTPQHNFAAGASDYERRIRTLVPGYDTLHALSAAMLRAQLPDTARVLCVGAGAGEELACLADAGRHWHLVGSDPSADMLAQARQRVQRAGIADRVTLITADVAQVPEAPPFDAATLLLVLHFVAADDARSALIRDIATRLKPGAPLLLASLCDSGATPTLLEAWKTLQELSGMTREAVDERMAPRLAEARPVGDEELGTLLASGGFTPPLRYFQGLMMAGWITWRR
ncbi:MAG TPA: class I SAM-dependent methyltransferase [Gammaproteobacteria bacterium]|uniref:SAM-dependent methyltransferase n=1 Tax=Immundisolibacter sp. TaxID=1934948 RepID=UPI000E93D428|nr:class I SAM-dependent methyltransferase [Gammaproteobacteria bacterium]HCZ47617.1 class I SAM-dependent methyltransferase [Gammaproteobacteria bacterium]MCH77055.1 class I SAM-dependent methyltransferase [Gammaproteobacteria bacterium]